MNNHNFVLPISLALTLLLATFSFTSWAQAGVAQSQDLPTNQIIIQFENTAVANHLLRSDHDAHLQLLSRTLGVNLWYKRPMSGNAYVLQLAEALSPSAVTAISAQLMGIDGVIYAEPDHIKQIVERPTRQLDFTPDDPRFGEQWHHIYTPETAEGLNLPPAWDITTGSSDTVIAVIDTGILTHTDLAGRTVPGYDFIGDVFVANDGDGRDPDPSDPGDWATPNECGFPHPGFPSSWHGTHVAGIIGAASNNAMGVVGVNWLASILPVRVLGKCGGYTSDIVDGMRWSAGISVAGVPDNANPADVLNLSFSGSGACSTTEQNAINDIVAQGATIVGCRRSDDKNNHS